MKYDVNLENFNKIINSRLVPDNAGKGFSWMIEDAFVKVTKPYTDSNGEISGNLIYASKGNVEISLHVFEDGSFFALYNQDEADGFVQLDADSPKEVIGFVNEIWPKIVDGMEEMENAPPQEVRLSLETFSKQFGKYQVPHNLKQLLDFENTVDAESFATCFSLAIIGNAGLSSWSSDPDFLNSFIAFANANGSGSFYAYWVIDDNLDNCPIVVFGDEGGIHIVAENTKQLIHLLSFGPEIFVSDESAYFFKNDEDNEEGEEAEAYQEWMERNFNLEPIETDGEADEIIMTAQTKYQKRLNEFIGKYYDLEG
jgi:hypothetical protein